MGRAGRGGGGSSWGGSSYRSPRTPLPHSIITDNDTNFTADEVKSWCKNMGIKLDYASVYHPQTNGQV